MLGSYFPYLLYLKTYVFMIRMYTLIIIIYDILVLNILIYKHIFMSFKIH